MIYLARNPCCVSFSFYDLASVFVGLASLIDRVGGRGELTVGKNIVVFSYGSGALATMYRLHV